MPPSSTCEDGSRFAQLDTTTSPVMCTAPAYCTDLPLPPCPRPATRHTPPVCSPYPSTSRRSSMVLNCTTPPISPRANMPNTLCPMSLHHPPLGFSTCSFIRSSTHTRMLKPLFSDQHLLVLGNTAVSSAFLLSTPTGLPLPPSLTQSTPCSWATPRLPRRTAGTAATPRRRQSTRSSTPPAGSRTSPTR